jgi:hypothetical protein
MWTKSLEEQARHILLNKFIYQEAKKYIMIETKNFQTSLTVAAIGGLMLLTTLLTIMAAN